MPSKLIRWPEQKAHILEELQLRAEREDCDATSLIRRYIERGLEADDRADRRKRRRGRR